MAKVERVFLLIMYALWGVMILFILSSCDPIKRHSRLVDRFPHVHTQDTIMVRDTIRAVVRAEKTDTIVHFKTLRDTLFIDKERVRVRINTIHVSVYVDAECKEVIVEKVVERKIPIVYYEKVPESSWLKYVIVFAIVLFTLYSIFNRKKDE